MLPSTKFYLDSTHRCVAIHLCPTSKADLFDFVDIWFAHANRFSPTHLFPSLVLLHQTARMDCVLHSPKLNQLISWAYPLCAISQTLCVESGSFIFRWTDAMTLPYQPHNAQYYDVLVYFIEYWLITFNFSIYLRTFSHLVSITFYTSFWLFCWAPMWTVFEL